MSAHQFPISYNGHPVTVTALENNVYMVQVTYKPIHIQLHKDENGKETWVDMETSQATYLSEELGKLITAHLCTS